MTLDSGNIRFMQIFMRVPQRGGIKRQWGNQKHGFSGLSDATSSAPQEMRPTLLYSIIQSRVAFPLTPKHVTLNGLKWPFYVKFSLLRTTLLHAYCSLFTHVTGKLVLCRAVVEVEDNRLVRFNNMHYTPVLYIIRLLAYTAFNSSKVILGCLKCIRLNIFGLCFRLSFFYFVTYAWAYIICQVYNVSVDISVVK